jgi:hypothetical protein
MLPAQICICAQVGIRLAFFVSSPSQLLCNFYRTRCERPQRLRCKRYREIERIWGYRDFEELE